jgi:hypothetical protein
MINRYDLTATKQRYHALLPATDTVDRILLALANDRLKAAAQYAQMVEGFSDPNDMIVAWVDRELTGAISFLMSIETYREHKETPQ